MQGKREGGVIVKPIWKQISDTKRQAAIAKYGKDIVDVWDSWNS